MRALVFLALAACSDLPPESGRFSLVDVGFSTDRRVRNLYVVRDAVDGRCYATSREMTHLNPVPCGAP